MCLLREGWDARNTYERHLSVMSKTKLLSLVMWEVGFYRWEDERMKEE